MNVIGTFSTSGISSTSDTGSSISYSSHKDYYFPHDTPKERDTIAIVAIKCIQANHCRNCSIWNLLLKEHSKTHFYYIITFYLMIPTDEMRHIYFSDPIKTSHLTDKLLIKQV